MADNEQYEATNICILHLFFIKMGWNEANQKFTFLCRCMALGYISPLLTPLTFERRVASGAASSYQYNVTRLIL